MASLYDNTIKHLDELRSEKIKSFDVTKMTINNFLTEWKPSNRLPLTDETSWIYVANPYHRQKLETETKAVEDDDDDGITYYTIVKDERGEQRFLEKHPDRNIKIVKRDDLKKLPLEKRIDILVDVWCNVNERKERQEVRINHSLIRDIGEYFGILGGKWCFSVRPASVDRVWEKICLAMFEGRFPESCTGAKVTTLRGSDVDSSMICVFNDNLLVQDDVIAVERAIRSLGIGNRLGYKPEICTFLNIYSDNIWNLRPTFYRSCWFDRLRCSMVLSSFKWDKLSFAIQPDHLFDIDEAD